MNEELTHLTNHKLVVDELRFRPFQGEAAERSFQIVSRPYK